MELTDYWKILRTHWKAVIAIILAGGLLGLSWSWLQPNVYTANASGIVSVGTSSDLGTAMAGESYSKSRVKSYLDLAKSRAVAQIAIDSLGLEVDPDSLISRITVSNPSDTATIKVSANSDNAEKARLLAEAWVSAIGVQIAEVENASAGSNSKSIVTFRSLDTALLPHAPSSPNTKMAVGLGLLVGAALAIGYALLRNLFDRRIHSVEQTEKETELAVIGTIPSYSGFNEDSHLLSSYGGNDRHPQNTAQYTIAESLRTLRTNLQFMRIDDPPRSIVITSALPGEGKSTIAANLAVAIAAAGREVILIDGDLRRPRLAEIFGLLPGVGLTDVLVGTAGIDDVLQPWGDSGKLLVLGAGKTPPNPSELLGSNAMHNLVEELSEHALVIIDAPPLLPVTDAAILTARTDGALVVALANKTTYDTLKAGLGSLERASGRALGIILNAVPEKGIRATGYGLQYRSYYGNSTQSSIQPTYAPTSEGTAGEDGLSLEVGESGPSGVATTAIDEAAYSTVGSTRRGRRAR